MKLLKKFIRERICTTWEKSFGPIGILVCDLSLNINLLRKRSPVEKKEWEEIIKAGGTYPHNLEAQDIPIDGDICWSSPGWYLADWVFRDETSTEDINRYHSVVGEPLFGFDLGV